MAGISFSKKERRTVIFAVTLGNLLEWYEIYLYVYWAPIIAELFFQGPSYMMNLAYTFMIFGMGFLARPLGGIFFGRLGDRIGRKKSLLLSLLIMIFPTFITGFLPTCQRIGCFAPMILALMRILQAFPAGGEIPGTMCYLYESSLSPTRKYMCSWGAVGYQLGILISTIECYLLEKFMDPVDLVNWGWRFSFIVGGCIGFLGLFLRYKLHETPLYQEMHDHEKVVRESISRVLYKYRKGILMGVLYCALNSSAFYFLSVNMPVYFVKLAGAHYTDSLLVTAFILLYCTIPLPFIGKLANKYDVRKILLYATGVSLVTLAPLYISITHEMVILLSICVLVFGLCLTIVTAMIAFILCDLFPTYARFTCVGTSFNVADAVIGGFTPFVSLLLLNYTGNQASFCWILLFFGALSMTSYYFMKEKHHRVHHLNDGG